MTTKRTTPRIDDDELVSLKDAAAITGYSERTLHRYIRSGRLQAFKHGARYTRVRRSELDSLIRPI